MVRRIIYIVRDSTMCGCNLAPSWVLDVAGRAIIIIGHSVSRHNSTWLLPLRISVVVEQISDLLIMLLLNVPMVIIFLTLRVVLSLLVRMRRIPMFIWLNYLTTEKLMIVMAC